MNKYTVTFSICNKKFRTVISANSKEDAEYKLRGAVRILECTENKSNEYDAFGFLTDIVNGKTK